MEKFTYEIPEEFSNDEKWLKYFSAKSAVAFVISAVVGVIISKGFEFLGILPVGVFIAVVIVIFCTGATMIPIPGENYTKGGGLTVDVYLAKRYVRWKNRVIYVNGCNDYEDEREEE